MSLLYNRKNWKRPIALVLILHWFFRSIGDLLSYRSTFMPWAPNSYWPYTDKGYLMASAIPNVFWLTGEIIGDWYPLLRTKAVTKNKKIYAVFATCLLYNSVKLFSMIALFTDLPIDFRVNDDEGNKIRDIARIKIRYWSTVLALQIASSLYDLSVILTLKTYLFDRLKEYNSISGKTFLGRFKQISEFRIVFSMIASMSFLPFIIGFVIYLVYTYNLEGTGSVVQSDEPVDGFRRAILNINFTLMYVDQILLKIISKKQTNNQYSYKNTFGNTTGVSNSASNSCITSLNRSAFNSNNNLSDRKIGSNNDVHLNIVKSNNNLYGSGNLIDSNNDVSTVNNYHSPIENMLENGKMV